MRRFTALVVAALMLAVPACAIARGSYIRPWPKIIRAGAPLPSDLGLSSDQLLGGCGTKRTRDSATHKCRGPADVSN
jgi:hypothetical protein